VDLSYLPTPDLVAPAFLRLLHESQHFGRYEAQHMANIATPEISR
jgi:hypothetical protein